MSIRINSLNIFTQVGQDSSISNLSKVKDSFQIQKNISNELKFNINSKMPSRQNEIRDFTTDLLFIKNKKDSDNLNSLLNTYSFEPWDKIISANNAVYKSKNKERAIFYNNKKTETYLKSQTSQKIPYFYKENFAINNAILILLLISFVLLAWIKIAFEKYLKQLLRAIINYSDEAKLFRDQNAMIDRLYLVLNIIFAITGGLFIYYFAGYYGKGIFLNNSFLNLLGCFGVIIVIYIYRYIIIKFFGFILYQNQAFNEYLHSTFIYYKAMGLFLTPLIFIIFILSENYKIAILMLSIITIFVLYFISIFRATRIMLQKGILLFYWILYLCTVEFLPIIMLYKFLKSEV